MKKAILYIRVSTDEQEDKGYSQRDQHETLQRYCEQNSIAILKVIFEDHSAKTFNRPEWSRMLSDLRRTKSRPDAVLFTKWDRFSRNVSESYQTIGVLAKIGVQPISIEQPLDMTNPESKMMLAIYLAAGEVDNDRRALNVFYGIRRAIFEKAEKKKQRHILSSLFPEKSTLTEWNIEQLDLMLYRGASADKQ